MVFVYLSIYGVRVLVSGAANVLLETVSSYCLKKSQARLCTRVAIDPELFTLNPYLMVNPLLDPLLVQLLHKLKIRASGNSTMLLKVVKNPVTRHLPPGCKTYGLSVTGSLYNPHHFAAQLPDDKPIVFYIGAMASGHITKEEAPEVMALVALHTTQYTTQLNPQKIEEMVAISEYPLSGAAAISRLFSGIENNWGIF
ncbi:unnamed protein product [Choristocarpus tenellus]